MTQTLNPLPTNAQFGYIPALDGIRAFAVMLVIVAHSGFEHLLPAGFGVTVFFFISGFLITRLLLAENDKTDTVDIKNFYIRRFIRLIPALYFMLIIVLGLQIIMSTPLKVWENIAAFTYTMNYREVYMEFVGIQRAGPFGHLWSLAVEEHFYLLFPLLVYAFRKKQTTLIKICLFLCAAIFVWRGFNHYILEFPTHYNYVATDARMDSILYGCLFSLILNQKSYWPTIKRFIGFVPLILSVLVLLFCFVYRDIGFRQTARYSLQGMAIGVGVLNLYFLGAMKPLIRLLETAPLKWTGKVSYGLYLWHIPAMYIADQYLGLSKGTLPFILFAYIVTFGATTFSFYYVEKPFISLRRKFGSHVKPANA